MFKKLKEKIQEQGHEMLQNSELLSQGSALIDNLVLIIFLSVCFFLLFIFIIKSN